MSSLAKLRRKDLIVVFTYAPVGLGHLRVTDALYEGLPQGIKPVLLGAQDKAIIGLHRLTSIHPILREIMEWVQRGRPEDIFTYFYRGWLRHRTKTIYQQMQTLLDQRLEKPQQVVVVATHFGLAHQLAAIKDRLEAEKKIKLFLAVQVTDDSPQQIWLVPGADLIFVPSQRTKRQLQAYGKTQNFKPVKFKVLPYPMNPKLSRKLTPAKLQQRQRQLNSQGQTAVKLIIPISGAAVGLKHFLKLSQTLEELSPRFAFYIVSRFSLYTQNFLRDILKRRTVKVFSHQADREVVNAYEGLYQKKVMALEITKPSEQAFKALLSPDQIGGSLLLFSEPVGRQEYDNLKFMRRHGLIPNPSDQDYLWRRAESGMAVERAALKLARHWRGLALPLDPVASAKFINWALEQGVFEQMLNYQPDQQAKLYQTELRPDGVKFFWQEVVNQLV